MRVRPPGRDGAAGPLGSEFAVIRYRRPVEALNGA